MLKNNRIRSLIICVFVAQAFPAIGMAQSPTDRPAPVFDIERAMQLETQARELVEREPTNFRKAARLLHEAARLRPDTDREAFVDLDIAGAIWYYEKDFDKSRAVMVEQAERALRVGEVGTAANAYIGAAFAAREQRDAAAFDYIEKARKLGTSSLLSSEERRVIAHRVGEPRATALGNSDR